MKKGEFMQVFLSLIGLLGIFYTVFLFFHSNINLGVLMPAIMGFPLLIVGVFLPYFGSLFGKILLMLMALAYIAFGVLFLYCYLLIKKTPLCKEREVDALIICGAAVRNGKMSLALEKRTRAALAYLQAHEKTICVVSGGKGLQETVSEAELMRRFLLKNGIAEERILFEDKAESTRQNMEFGAKLVFDRLGKEASLAVVTSDFHIYRAVLEARKIFPEALGITSRSEWFMKPSYYLRETAAITKTRFLS